MPSTPIKGMLSMTNSKSKSPMSQSTIKKLRFDFKKSRDSSPESKLKITDHTPFFLKQDLNDFIKKGNHDSLRSKSQPRKHQKNMLVTKQSQVNTTFNSNKKKPNYFVNEDQTSHD